MFPLSVISTVAYNQPISAHFCPGCQSRPEPNPAFWLPVHVFLTCTYLPVNVLPINHWFCLPRVSSPFSCLNSPPTIYPPNAQKIIEAELENDEHTAARTDALDLTCMLLLETTIQTAKETASQTTPSLR